MTDDNGINKVGNILLGEFAYRDFWDFVRISKTANRKRILDTSMPSTQKIPDIVDWKSIEKIDMNKKFVTNSRTADKASAVNENKILPYHFMRYSIESKAVIEKKKMILRILFVTVERMIACATDNKHSTSMCKGRLYFRCAMELKNKLSMHIINAAFIKLIMISTN